MATVENYISDRCTIHDPLGERTGGGGDKTTTHLFTGFIYPIFPLFIIYDVSICVTVGQKAVFHMDILSIVPFD